MLETEKGESWSVTVFICPINELITVLPALWDVLVQNIEIAQIPHYTIRVTIRDLNNRPQAAVISWRVLRKEENSTRINEIITEKLIEFQITPLEGEEFMNYHKWYLTGEVREVWTRERCEILHQLSKTAILLMKKDLFKLPLNTECSRHHILHLLANMVGLQEESWKDVLNL